MESFLFGVIIGLIIGFFIPKDRTINQIKKLKTKGDNSPISTRQTEKRRGFLKRIFKRKNKKT